MGRKLPRQRPSSEDEMPLFNPPSTIGPNRWDEVARVRARARAPTTSSMITQTVAEGAPAVLGVPAVPPSTPKGYAAVLHLVQTQLRAARGPAPPLDPTRTRVRRQATEPSITETGTRADRDSPLTHEDLWVGDGRPPEVVASRDHHKCGICQFVKSHPVS
ncbi:hypothetical protein C8J57DRAFT_1528766 [Mycena rebaudengoi]|nr:hypothetical protein C8J57DRAFT_1528766 [Mycena rebaudengoi]